MTEPCNICGGAGMVLGENAQGNRVARICACQQAARAMHRVLAARIPPRYEHCTLDTYDATYPNSHPSLQRALLSTQGFVNEYPFGTDGRGLLFTGSIGVGKTHLAVGTLRFLMEERGAKGLFCDYRELLKEIQHSYNAQSNSTELGVLKPVFEAEVLVLDELGAQKPTEWVWDTVSLILNSRYNEKKTTIITSNFANLAVGEVVNSETKRSLREDTLGDRIGERMRSRLYEMCAGIELTGKDFRRLKSASFTLS